MPKPLFIFLYVDLFKDIFFIDTSSTDILPHYEYQSGTFVIIHKPILIHHYHPKSTVYIRYTLGDVHSVGLGKYIMHVCTVNSVIQRSFTALKKSSVLCLFIPLFPLTSGNP